MLSHLELEDAAERAQGLPSAVRARAVAPTTGRLLFLLVAPQADCEVLEIGGSRGYSTIWLAAGVRHFGGRVLSLENDPLKIDAWRRNIAEAGLEQWAESQGDALETLPGIQDVFDVVFIDAEKEDYERLFHVAREKVEPAALVVADTRPLPPGGAGPVLGRPPGRSDARERHRAPRPGPRAERRPALEHFLICADHRTS